jgi:hypothetical protein
VEKFAMRKALLIFRRGCIAALVAFICIGAFGSSFAASRKVYGPGGGGSEERFSVSLGGFLVRFDTAVRVDSETLGTGTEIDLEDDTGLDRDKTDLMLDGYLRLGRRHRINFGARFLSRGTSIRIDEEIRFRDETFEIEALVSTEFSNDVFNLGYQYSFLRNDRVEVGASIGVSAFVVDVALSAEAEAGEISVESEDFIAPIPVVGLHLDLPLGEKWSFRAGAEYFKVSVDEREGSLSDLSVSVDWQPFEHFGFGIGYNNVRLTYTDLSRAEVDFSYNFSGALVYATYVF